MVKTTSILNLNRDENQMIFKNVFEFRLQISRSRDPPVCALSHMAIIVPIIYGHNCAHMGRRKDRGCLNCKRNSITITLWKHSSFNENQHIWRYKISHMGLPKDRGVVNCKINSFTISSLKHSCFNENEQIWGCKICHNYGHDCCHMGQLKDGGCLNCKRNSITITLWKHSSFNEN